MKVKADLNGNSNSTDTIRYYNPSITETHRPGVINKFTYDYGNHQIVAGHWFEYAMHHQTSPYAALNADGTVADYFADAGGISLNGGTCTQYSAALKTYIPATCPTGMLQRTRDFQTDTMTDMVFLGDTWKATDKLTVIYGAKQVWVDRTVDSNLPGGTEQSLYDTATLPTAGVRYQLDKDNTVFANFSTSFRSPPNYTLTAAGNYIANTTVPMEEGKSFEIGHRYQGSTFATSVTAFYGTFQNYQVSTNVYDDAGTSQQVTVNAGDVINYGINAELGLRPIYNLRPYVSGELIRTEMLDNALEAYGTLGGTKVNDYLRTSGKQLPGTPNYSFGLGIDYDDDHIIGNIGFKWIGSQYATFMNDEKLDAFGRVDAMIGYRFDNFGWLKRPEIKLNIYNIANTDDLTGVYSIKNNAKTTTGVNGSTITSSAPTYYMGQGASFLVTFSTGL